MPPVGKSGGAGLVRRVGVRRVTLRAMRDRNRVGTGRLLRRARREDGFAAASAPLCGRSCPAESGTGIGWLVLDPVLTPLFVLVWTSTRRDENYVHALDS